jgi:hypothetical protein
VATIAVDADAAWFADTVPTLQVRSLEDGRREVTLAVVSTVWFGHLLLQLGRRAQVCSPEELFGAGADAARRVLARYGDRKPSTPAPSPPRLEPK